MLPDVLPEESRVGGEGDRRLQVAEFGPPADRSSRRSGVPDLARHAPRGPFGGDLDLRDGKGDLARGTRSRSKGERDLLLWTVSITCSKFGFQNVPFISPWRSRSFSSIVISSR